MATGADWASTGKGKRVKVSALLPAKWKIGEPVPDPCSLPNATEYPGSFLTQSEIGITEAFTAQALVRKIVDGGPSHHRFLSPSDDGASVGKSTLCRLHFLPYSLTTLLAEQTNCLSEVMFEETLRRASELDLYFETH